MAYLCLPGFCLKCCTSKKFRSTLEKNDRRIDESLDIVGLMRSQGRLRILEKLFLTKAQRTLLKHHEDFWLVDINDNDSESGGQSNDQAGSDQSENEENYLINA